MKTYKLYGGIDYGLLKEKIKDGLREWKYHSVLVTKKAFMWDMAVWDEDTILIGTNQGLWISKDGGKTWSKISFFDGKIIYALYKPPVFDKDILLISANNKVYYTEDLENFTEVLSLPENDRVIHFTQSEVDLYCHGYGPVKDGYSNAVFYSIDGKTWTKIWEIPDTSPERHIHGIGAYPLRKDVWICTGDTEHAIHVSFDYGKTFERIDKSTPGIYPVCRQPTYRVGDNVDMVVTPRTVLCSYLGSLFWYVNNNYIVRVDIVNTEMICEGYPVMHGLHYDIFNNYLFWSRHWGLWSDSQPFRIQSTPILVSDDHGFTWKHLIPTSGFHNVVRTFKDYIFIASSPGEQTLYRFEHVVFAKMYMLDLIKNAEKIPITLCVLGKENPTYPIYVADGQITTPIPMGQYRKIVLLIKVNAATTVEIYGNPFSYMGTDTTTLHSYDVLLETVTFSDAGTKVVTLEPPFPFLKLRVLTGTEVAVLAKLIP